MYEINPPRSAEDALGYSHDEGVAKKARVRLPVLAPSEELPPATALLADSVVLPRDYDKRAADKLKRLRRIGAPDVPMPPGAGTSFMSINRHVVAPQWDAKKGAPSVREQLTSLLAQRKLVLYVDRTRDEPVRVAILPPLRSGELDEMFRRAGYTARGSAPQRVVVGSMGLLTETSKMGCYSFNLPAGPKYVGGTCPAAGLGFMYGTIGQLLKSQAGKRDKAVMIDPERFICNGCYAMKGAYGNPSTVANMQIRMVLVTALLRGGANNVYYVSAEEFEQRKAAGRGKSSPDPQALFASGLKRAQMGFADVMILAISEARARVAQRRAVLEAFGYTVSEYKRTEEILEWLNARKRIRSLVNKVGSEGEGEVQAEIDRLLEKTGMTLDEALSKRARYKKVFADWQLPDPKFFRIHDAGDMFSDQYFREWLKVCKHFSRGEGRVQFWAPTRMWAFAGGLRDQSLNDIPENLAMRPSTLHFRDTAPSRSYLHRTLRLPRYKKGKGGGLSAPSGSAPQKPTAKDFKCPAYEHWSTGVGGAIRLDPRTQKGVGGTCITARGPDRENGCRACWQHHELVVFYEEH